MANDAPLAVYAYPELSGILASEDITVAERSADELVISSEVNPALLEAFEAALASGILCVSC